MDWYQFMYSIIQEDPGTYFAPISYTLYCIILGNIHLRVFGWMLSGGYCPELLCSTKREMGANKGPLGTKREL